MKHWLSGILLCGLMLPGFVRAEDGPPNEPPYTNIDEEFNQANETATHGGELKAGEAAPIPVSDQPEVIEAPETPMSRSVTAPPSVQRERPAATSRAQKIAHPDAKKGLYLIDRDGSYYYTPQKFAKKEQTSSIRFGSILPPKITSADGITTYSSMYGSSSPSVLMYDYEWKPWQGFGALGVQAGFGFFSATGKGHFLVSTNADGTPEEARESYTFYAFPLSLGGLYRFEYTDNQWVSPYIAGGLTYFALAEMRDDGKSPKFVGTPAAYGAGGLLFNLSVIDRETGFALDAEYGIATLWLTAEVRQIQSANKELDFSGTMFSLGLAADY